MSDPLPDWAPSQRSVAIDPTGRAKWLGWFGISEWMLRETVAIYSATFRDRRPNDPRSRYRVVAHQDGVRAIRQRLIEPMWLPDDTLNRGAVVSQDRRFALRLRSGDENTGFIDRVPRTWGPLGSTWHDAIAANQLLLPHVIPPQISKLRSGLFRATGEPLTLMLLIYEDGTDTRVELAIPDEIRFADEEGFSHLGWWLRILILGGDAHATTPARGTLNASPSGQVQDDGLSLEFREALPDGRVQPQTADNRTDEASADEGGARDSS